MGTILVIALTSLATAVVATSVSWVVNQLPSLKPHVSTRKRIWLATISTLSAGLVATVIAVRGSTAGPVATPSASLRIVPPAPSAGASPSLPSAPQESIAGGAHLGHEAAARPQVVGSKSALAPATTSLSPTHRPSPTAAAEPTSAGCSAAFPMPASRYFDVDHCPIQPDENGTADDDVQISPANLVAHGGAGGLVPQSTAGADCATVSTGDREYPAFGTGPFCGISGNPLNNRRFLLTITNYEKGTVWIRITYL